MRKSPSVHSGVERNLEVCAGKSEAGDGFAIEIDGAGDAEVLAVDRHRRFAGSRATGRHQTRDTWGYERGIANADGKFIK